MGRRKVTGMTGGSYLSATGAEPPGSVPVTHTHHHRKAILRTLDQATRMVGSPQMLEHPLTPSEAAQMKGHIQSLGTAVAEAGH